MKPQSLLSLLSGAFRNGRKVLIKGAPGIGKSDIVAQAATAAGSDLVLMHPAVSDPTDYKGMPAIVGAAAEFLPFGDLNRLIKAERPTVAFLDDIGQAPVAVQAALMQLILARRVNGHVLSPHVTFCGATNDTRHLAGCSGLIEPVKSRWDTIVELEPSIDDWTTWALDSGLVPELVAFIRFRPALLSAFKPTKELTNSPCPRTWASVGKWLADGVKDLEVLSGCVGEGAAAELIAFLQLAAELPSLDAILLDPDGTMVPTKPAQLYAVTAGLARKANKGNADRVFRYLARLPKEFEVYGVRDAVRSDKTVTQCRAFVEWSVKNADAIA